MATGVERLENKKRAAVYIIFPHARNAGTLSVAGSSASQHEAGQSNAVPANIGHVAKVLEGLWEHDARVTRAMNQRKAELSGRNEREAKHAIRSAFDPSNDFKFLGDPYSLFVPLSHGFQLSSCRRKLERPMVLPQHDAACSVPLGFSSNAVARVHNWKKHWDVLYDVFKSATVMLRRGNIDRISVVCRCSRGLCLRVIKCLWKMVAMQFVLKPLLIDLKRTYAWDVHERVIDFGSRLALVLGHDPLFVRWIAYRALPLPEWMAGPCVQCACKTYRDALPPWVDPFCQQNHHFIERNDQLNSEQVPCHFSTPCASLFGVHEILTAFHEGVQLNFMEKQMYACGFGSVNSQALAILQPGEMCRLVPCFFFYCALFFAAADLSLYCVIAVSWNPSLAVGSIFLPALQRSLCAYTTCAWWIHCTGPCTWNFPSTKQTIRLEPPVTMRNATSPVLLAAAVAAVEMTIVMVAYLTWILMRTLVNLLTLLAAGVTSLMKRF